MACDIVVVENGGRMIIGRDVLNLLDIGLAWSDENENSLRNTVDCDADVCASTYDELYCGEKSSDLTAINKTKPLNATEKRNVYEKDAEIMEFGNKLVSGVAQRLNSGPDVPMLPIGVLPV